MQTILVFHDLNDYVKVNELLAIISVYLLWGCCTLNLVTGQLPLKGRMSSI